MIELIVTLLVTGLGWLIYEACTAPAGWEDEDGFHYDEK